jgi:poly [ADP-ribose] polymerase 2/3/4
MAPAKRKAAAATQTAPKKTQKTQKKGKGKAKPKIQVPIDDAFSSNHPANVYIADDGTIYDASLNQTNTQDNNNKFYFLQLLKCDNCGDFFVHTRWGRVGEYGQFKTTGPTNEDDAMTEFEKKFQSKTGLSWDDRNEEALGGKKYTYLEKAYDDDDEDQKNSKKDKNAVKSKLPLQTQRLIELIFNENHFNSV